MYKITQLESTAGEIEPQVCDYAAPGKSCAGCGEPGAGEAQFPSWVLEVKGFLACGWLKQKDLDFRPRLGNLVRHTVSK